MCYHCIVYTFWFLFFFFLGFNLFKTFFENVNLCDHRLKRQGTQLVRLALFIQLVSFKNYLDGYALRIL